MSTTRGAGPAHHNEFKNTSFLVLATSFCAVVVFFIAFSSLAGAAPTSCGWCGRNGFDEGVRRLLFIEKPLPAAKLSHVLAVVVAPLLAVGALAAPAVAARRFGDALRNLAILTTAFVLTTAIADGVKKLVARERPGFAHDRAALLEAADEPLERYLSFFSGDTAWAFVLAATMITLARLRGYRLPRWVATVAIVVACLVGVLRMVADMHWATDVLAGAAVGTLVGVVVPSLLHGRRPSSLEA